jgi:hypothetical protein
MGTPSASFQRRQTLPDLVRCPDNTNRRGRLRVHVYQGRLAMENRNYCDCHSSDNRGRIDPRRDAETFLASSLRQMR